MITTVPCSIVRPYIAVWCTLSTCICDLHGCFGYNILNDVVLIEGVYTGQIPSQLATRNSTCCPVSRLPRQTITCAPVGDGEGGKLRTEASQVMKERIIYQNNAVLL